MNKEAYWQALEENFDTCLEISKRKSADYTGDDGVFANFERSAKFAGVTVEQGMMVRIADKISRLESLSDGREAQVKDEAIEDTLRDLINYTNILLVYREHGRN